MRMSPMYATILVCVSLVYISVVRSEPAKHRASRAKREVEDDRDFWDKHGVDILQGIGGDTDDGTAYPDNLPSLAKRYAVNSYQLFRPFYHPRRTSYHGVQQSSDSRQLPKRSYNDLIAKLLALKGRTPPARLSFVRYGPGGR